MASKGEQAAKIPFAHHAPAQQYCRLAMSPSASPPGPGDGCLPCALRNLPRLFAIDGLRGKMGPKLMDGFKGRLT